MQLTDEHSAMRNHRFPHASEDSDAICVGPIVTLNQIMITMSSGSLIKSKNTDTIFFNWRKKGKNRIKTFISATIFFFSCGELFLTHIINVTSWNWRLGQKVDGFELNSVLGAFLGPNFVFAWRIRSGRSCNLRFKVRYVLAN